MKLLVSFLLAIVLFGFAGISAANAQSAPDWRLIPAQSASCARHLIITVKRDTPENLKQLMQTLQDSYPVDAVAEWPLASIDVHCFVLRVSRFASVSEIISRLEQDAVVRTVQPMNQFRTLAAGDTYQDDLFNLQTNLKDLDVVEAHRHVTGRNVKVAVIDTGVDTSHPDFVRQNIKSKDFVGVRLEQIPREKHGTAIAGLIAASNVNKKGIVGIAQNASVFAMRGCWQPTFGRSSGRCSSFSLARALNFAIINDIDIINMSLGGPYDPLLEEIINVAVEKHGIIIVAAYGKSSKARFPATAANVIGVTGMARRGNVVSAPGVDILSTAPNGKYDFYSGSSVATAHVSGVVALMLEANRSLRPSEILRLMKGSRTGRDERNFFNTCKIISSIKPVQCL